MAKPKTRTEMAGEYGVNRKTFSVMLKRVDLKLYPGLITPKEQEEIYQTLGKPSQDSKNDKKG